MANLKDYATSTVLTPPSPSDSGVTFQVQAGHGVRFPTAPFKITACPEYQLPTLDNAEKMLVTDVTGDTFTVTRNIGETGAKNVDVGWRIANTIFEEDLPRRFITNKEDYSLTVEYYGKQDQDDQWLIHKLTDTTEEFASIKNNPSEDDYEAAWLDRTNLIYGSKSDAL